MTMPELPLKPPAKALYDMIADVDALVLRANELNVPMEALAGVCVALAQVKATSALVHAVRELTDVLRGQET